MYEDAIACSNVSYSFINSSVQNALGNCLPLSMVRHYYKFVITLYGCTSSLPSLYGCTLHCAPLFNSEASKDAAESPLFNRLTLIILPPRREPGSHHVTRTKTPCIIKRALV